MREVQAQSLCHPSFFAVLPLWFSNLRLVTFTTSIAWAAPWHPSIVSTSQLHSARFCCAGALVGIERKKKWGLCHCWGSTQTYIPAEKCKNILGWKALKSCSDNRRIIMEYFSCPSCAPLTAASSWKISKFVDTFVSCLASQARFDGAVFFYRKLRCILCKKNDSTLLVNSSLRKKNPP